MNWHFHWKNQLQRMKSKLEYEWRCGWGWLNKQRIENTKQLFFLSEEKLFTAAKIFKIPTVFDVSAFQRTIISHMSEDGWVVRAHLKLPPASILARAELKRFAANFDKWTDLLSICSVRVCCKMQSLPFDAEMSVSFGIRARAAQNPELSSTFETFSCTIRCSAQTLRLFSFFRDGREVYKSDIWDPALNASGWSYFRRRKGIAGKLLKSAAELWF